MIKVPAKEGWRVVAAITGVFVAELAVLSAIRSLLPSSGFVDDVASALALTIIAAPFIWLIVRKQLARNAESARLRFAARLATILQTSTDGFITTDAHGTISQFNSGAETIFGYEARDVIGRNVSLLLPERVRDPHEGHVASVAAGPDVSRLMGQGTTLEGRRKNGVIFPVEATIAKFGDGDDATLTAVVRDATDRKGVEERLRLFRALLDRSNDIIEVVDPETGRFLDVNEQGCVKLGYSREEMLSLRVIDIDPTLDPSTFGGSGAELRESSVMLRQGLHRRKDGSTFPVEVSISRFELDRKYALAVVRDVSDRQRAEADLLLQSTALNSSADPIVITIRDGTIVWVNAAFTECTGYSAADAVGRNPRALLRSGVHDHAFYKELWDTVLAGKVWRGEMTNRRKDGSLYPELQTITPVLGAHGDITHFVAVKRDLTKEKHLQAQFLQAQKMESVGRLAGGVAHDFNNLLSVVNGWTEMAMLDLPAESPIRPALDEVLSAGQRAAALTRQLLAFSRQQVVEPSIFNVNSLVVEMDKMFRRILGEDIELSTRGDPDLGSVKMDRRQLEQVLMNLAVNARDAMPRGGKLTIETGNVVLDADSPRKDADVANGEYVMLAVSDSGTGMSDSVLSHLFEPFFTTKVASKGTGLGLATSYGIVKQAGGHILAYSEVGVGTTMKIHLPRTYESAEDVTRPRRVTPLRGVETILLVEDEQAVRRVTARMLEARGYRVLRAGSAEEALREIAKESEPLHLLLTDVVLAGEMSGRELADRVRVLKPKIKVLFVSGYTSDATMLHGLLEQGITLVQKPYTAETLGARVRQVLDAR